MEQVGTRKIKLNGKEIEMIYPAIILVFANNQSREYLAKYHQKILIKPKPKIIPIKVWCWMMSFFLVMNAH
ncbi:hypothetical protein LCGC14_0848710 [marine sediment metagenome]|uniref:Uncharacterized protein n=1 Tax=marine sediment metagenome TaxID=412755 RepID=A0A0F9PFQ1_9ZZZZ